MVEVIKEVPTEEKSEVLKEEPICQSARHRASGKVEGRERSKQKEKKSCSKSKKHRE